MIVCGIELSIASRKSVLKTYEYFYYFIRISETSKYLWKAKQQAAYRYFPRGYWMCICNSRTAWHLRSVRVGKILIQVLHDKEFCEPQAWNSLYIKISPSTLSCYTLPLSLEVFNKNTKMADILFQSFQCVAIIL